ncbi:hypothetical protein LB503_012444 [Fusarium chuoi]|nr:hypothetical protein LB503_012444 [Fusarium chuoi]
MPSTSMSGPSIAEEEANSTLSNDDGSSGDESRMTSAGPNKKRRREKHQKISCEMCKARKVKCDRAEPACSWCARHNRACVYLERQKPGAGRNGFSIELEAKVNRIDALLQALGRRVEEHIVQDHSSRIWATASGWETYAEHKSSKTVFVLAGEITRHHKSMAAYKQPEHYSVANADSTRRQCTNAKSIKYCAKSTWREARSIVSVVHD